LEKQQFQEKLLEEEKAKLDEMKEREKAFKSLHVQKNLQLIRESNKRQREETNIPIVIPDRNPEVFAPSSTPFDPQSINIPDDFYDVTVEDLKLNAQIIKERKKEENEEKIRPPN